MISTDQYLRLAAMTQATVDVLCRAGLTSPSEFSRLHDEQTQAMFAARDIMIAEAEAADPRLRSMREALHAAGINAGR